MNVNVIKIDSATGAITTEIELAGAPAETPAKQKSEAKKLAELLKLKGLLTQAEVDTI